MRRTAVVTGGGSGIGRAVAAHLSRQGRRVAVLDRDGDAARSVADALVADGGQALGLAVDVAERASVEAAFDAVRGAFGPPTVLVTSAAVAGFRRLEDIALEDWDRHVAVNLSGTFSCVQLAVADMVQAGWGRVVTVASAAGQSGSARQVHYSATKGGVIALTKAVAKEFGGRGITANSVSPFAAATPMLAAATASQDLPGPEVLARVIPAGRVGTPDEVAAVCAFLCSEEAGYVNGQNVAVNGGALT